MIRSLLCMAAFTALLAGVAQAESPGCREARDQASMNRCAEEEFQAADRELNDAYGRLMAALNDEGRRDKLRSAQRAWIRFRDSKCRYESADNEGGSIYPLVYAGCLTRLTRVRSKELNDDLVCWRNGEKCGM